jgi:hypothetical protein
MLFDRGDDFANLADDLFGRVPAGYSLVIGPDFVEVANPLG